MNAALIDRRVAVSLVAALSITVAVLYTLPVLVHFELGGYFMDAGWYAYLFGSQDPILQNPAALNSLSLYDYHMSPIVYIWSLLTSGLLGLSGFQSFALFHGVSVALASLGLGLWLLRSGLSRWRFIATLGIIAAYFVSNEFLLRATGYPHYEVVILGLSTLLFVASAERRWRISTVVILLLGLSREDGGLYAAYIICCVTALYWRKIERGERSRLAWLFLTGLILSAISFLIQALFFSGIPAFAVTFSGNGFNHLTLDFIADRAAHLVFVAGFLPLLSCIALLGLFGREYLIPFILISPLLALHIIAVRDELGLFTLYYGIPLALLGILVLIIAVQRSTSSKFRPLEALIVCIMVAATSTAGWAFMGLEGSSTSVLRDLMFRIPEGTTVQHRETIGEVLSVDADAVCGSIGVVALDPNVFRPGQFVEERSDISHCDRILLFEGDMHYWGLKEEIVRKGFELEGKARKIETYARSSQFKQ